MTKTLRGITIGAGHFADIQLEAWSQVTGAEIVGLVNRSLPKAEVLAKKFGISFVGTDIHQAIEELQPDFIDICTPPSSHFEYTKIAVDKQIPVLCQKPVAPNQEESRGVVEYAEAHGVRLMVNENWRWQAWYQEIQRLLSEGVLGQVFHVDVSMRPGDGFGSSPYPDQPYFKDMEKFLLFETGVHYFDTLQSLFGPIRKVYCVARTVNSVIKGEDYVVVTLEFQSGLTAIYDANRVAHVAKIRSESYGWMRIEGTMGNLRLDLDGHLFITPRGDEEYEHQYAIPAGWKGGCAVATQQHFVDALQSNQPFVTGGGDYIKTQDVVYACYRSAQTGMPVSLTS